MPIIFMCSRCRGRRYGFLTYESKPLSMLGTSHDVRLTGRKRSTPHGRSGIRNSHHKREYYCRKCGHTGWSRHIDLQHKERYEENL